MKNIKIYEEFTEELFKEVEYDEWQKSRDRGNCEFNREDMKILNNTFKFKLKPTVLTYSIDLDNYIDSKAYIYKTNDEWYHILLHKELFDIDLNFRIKRTYYICDQLDGLIACLKFIKDNDTH